MTGQSETKHTRGELRIVVSDTLFTMVSDDGIQVAKTSWHGSIRKPYPLRDEARANAARIVLTWNCHDELVAAARLALTALDRVMGDTDPPNDTPELLACQALSAALSRATSPTP